MTFPLLIIDCDSIKYAVSACIQKYDKETEVLKIEPVHHAYHNATAMIDKMTDVLQSQNIEVYLTKLGDRTNYRYQYLQTYKENRSKYEKPVFLKEVHDFILNKYKAIEAVGEEADDLVSIRHTEMNPLGHSTEVKNSIICSIDKDLDTVPGWHYNYMKGELYFLTELDSKKKFWVQMLAGDVADNVPRIKKGWRQKKTEDLIMNAENESEIIKIVRNEILELFYTDSNERSLTHTEVQKLIDEEIDWRGKVLHMRRYPNEIWELEDESKNATERS